MKPIQMVDLKGQFQGIAAEVRAGLDYCLENGAFIGGKPVADFAKALGTYLDVPHVIPCANGTDALQIALMALDLKAGDEVIVPSFTYVATAEVIGLLGLTPVMVDVDLDSFNLRVQDVLAALSPKTKAVVPVHLFGQTADMEAIIQCCQEHQLYLIEDNAQALGAYYQFKDGSRQAAGSLGHIGCTSFYPSKNLGAYGDGGAMFCRDEVLAEKLRTIANHGQRKRYYHDLIGVNSRLDAFQAVILQAKLAKLDQYIAARQAAANYYDQALGSIAALRCPQRQSYSNHVFHQYTLRVLDGRRDELQTYLQSQGIPSMIYYPLPLYEQPAFKNISRLGAEAFPNTETLCAQVISLPMHTELDQSQLAYICEHLTKFFA